ncbi:hypothetical protein EC968_010448, partial [Mortierella alpina]
MTGLVNWTQPGFGINQAQEPPAGGSASAATWTAHTCAALALQVYRQLSTGFGPAQPVNTQLAAGIGGFITQVGDQLHTQMVTHWKTLTPELIKKVKEENFEWVSGNDGTAFLGAVDDKGVSNVHDPVSVFFILNGHLSPESQFKFVPMSGYTDQFCNIPEAVLMAALLRQQGANPITRNLLIRVFGNMTSATNW